MPDWDVTLRSPVGPLLCSALVKRSSTQFPVPVARATAILANTQVARLWLQCVLSMLVVSLAAIPSLLHAQLAPTRREIVRGKVTADSGAALPVVEVIVTMAPDRVSKATSTDAAGVYEITFENGTGDYLVHFSAPGWQTFRKRVTRTGGDSVFVVDARLAPARVQQLAPVSVRATKPRPSRGTSIAPETGASERTADGVNGAVPPDQAGDLNAIAGTIPGVAVTPGGGVSIGGLNSAQNSTTLGGMAFAGTDIPRDAPKRVRVASSTYDPARGWFSGLQQDVELSPGNLFSSRSAHVTVDAPALQYTDPVAAALGQRFTNLQASIGGNGATPGDVYLYTYGAQAARRSSGITSLGDASPGVLASAGVSSDSAARLLGLLAAAGIPVTGSGVPAGRTSQSASFIGRIDRAPYNWTTFQPARQTWGLLGYARVASSDAVGLLPTATATYGGRTSEATGVLQGLFSSFIRGDYLTEAKSALTLSRKNAEPFLALPAGRVLVASSLPDGADGVAPLAFGGTGSLSNTRQWTWETMSETRFYVPGRSTHYVKLNADVRLDGVSEMASANTFGTFAFNSLADFAANRPASFTRTLNAPIRTGGEWNGFVALGDLWRKSPTFQLLYGARIEGNRFTSVPQLNPLVQSTFGVRTDRAPNTVHMSPRIGFTWVRRSSGPGSRAGMTVSPLGTFYLAPTGYLRGGIGEFRSFIPATLLTTASITTGLPNGFQSLTCIGSAVPAPLWAEYAAGTSPVPEQCAGVSPSPVLADGAPSVQLFDPSYSAPRSWRGNLGYSSTVMGLTYAVDALYSLNLNQPSRTDLNFAGLERFVTPNEGRPVFASPSGVVPASGAVSSVEARRVPSFGRVFNNSSDLRSVGRQVTFTLAPSRGAGRNWFASGAYTLASSRAVARGFDGSTFGSPLAREWARGDLDIRHQFLMQGGITRKQVTLTFFGRVQSGIPFTPMVSGDVNGDGLLNDRAFVFDPSRINDPALASATRSLIGSVPSSVRECLTRQLSRAAGRNSCEGPWTAALNAQLAFNVRVPRTTRDATIALAFVNPLSGLDQLLHGSNNLRGWGTAYIPDPTLYNVRGFDPSSNTFRYEVNPRFGTVNPALTTQRTPFRVTLDVRLDVGTPVPQQQLDRWLKPGRAGRKGPRLTAPELKKRYQRNVTDPYAGILRESDSLLITRDQAEAIEKAQVAYQQRVDSMWTSLAEYLANLGDNFDAADALKRQEQVIDDVWEMSRQDVQRTLPAILSPVQLELLPWPASLLYTSKEKVKIRIFMSGG